jgi:flagellin
MVGLNGIIGGSLIRGAQPSRRSFPVSLEMLSRGLRANKDAGHGKESFETRPDGLDDVFRTIQTAQNMIQAAEEGTGGIMETLQMMRQLAARAADRNASDRDRAELKEKIRLLLNMMNDRIERTRYNGRKLLDGSMSAPSPAQEPYARIQTNSILRHGGRLLDIDLSAAAAGTYAVVDQGTYEVRLVISDENQPEDGNPRVDAVISWTDSSAAPEVIGTLKGVSEGAKALETGGVILTVNTVSRRDVGAVGYAKTLAYVGPVEEDNSLTLRVGAEADDLLRLGIDNLSAGTLFRPATPSRDHGPLQHTRPKDPHRDSDPVLVSLDTPHEAQDLIGRIDDALRKVRSASFSLAGLADECSRAFERHTQRSTGSAGIGIKDDRTAHDAASLSTRSIVAHSPAALSAQGNTTSRFVLQLFAP